MPTRTPRGRARPYQHRPSYAESAARAEGVVPGHLDEWCIADRARAWRLRRSSDRPGPADFRTVVPTDRMLALLAI